MHTKSIKTISKTFGWPIYLPSPRSAILWGSFPTLATAVALRKTLRNLRAIIRHRAIALRKTAIQKTSLK